MSTPDGYTRIGIAFNPRQIARLRAMTERLGITQTALFTACLDTLDDEEVKSIIRRHSIIKIAAYTEKVLGKVDIAL